MNLNVKVKVTGVNEVRKALNRYVDESERRLATACYKTAQAVASHARKRFVRAGKKKGPRGGDIWIVPDVRDAQGRLTPHWRSGNLARRTVALRGKGLSPSAWVVSNTPYAMRIEYGYPRDQSITRAHPFLFPSAEEERHNHNKRIRQAMSLTRRVVE